MKKIVIMGIYLCSLILIVLFAFSSTKEKKITIHNKSNLIIEKIYFSEESKDEWIEVRFSKDNFKNEKKVAVLFDVGKEGFYDMKIVTSNGHNYIYEKKDLYNEKEIYLFLEDKFDESDSDE